MSELRLKSSQFRREREAAWIALEGLVDKADRYGIRELDAADVLRLATLYRNAVGSLATARAISLDRNVLEYLEALVARAHLCVYGFRQRPREAVADFVLGRFPRTVRRFAGPILACIALLVLAAGAGALLVARDSDRYYDIVSAEEAQGRTPAATTEELKAVLYDSGNGGAFELESFATFLFTHNAKVGLLCAASGLAAGVPVPALVSVTGLQLGAMAELYGSRGLGLEFFAWVLPHGVTEMLALVLCAAAGLAVGLALLFPGGRSRRDALGRAGREASTLVLGAVGMFLVAGLIEGIFRQSVQSPAIRWAVAFVSLAGWTVYFLRAGRNRGNDPA